MNDGFDSTSPLDPPPARPAGREPDPDDPEPAAETRPLGPPAEDRGQAGGSEPGGAGAGPARSWRLRRSVTDRKLSGVAGGIAAAADVDPTLVRILFAVSALSGVGLLAYLVLALVLQDETAEDRAQALPREQQRVLRIGLAVAAGVSVIRVFDGWFLGIGDGDMALPLVLIAAGAAVLWARRDVLPTPAGAAPPPGAGDPFAPATQAGAGGVGGPPPPPWPVASAPGAPATASSSTARDLLLLAAAFLVVGALIAFVGGAFLVVVGAVPMRLPFLPALVALVALVGLVVSIARRNTGTVLASAAALLLAAVLAIGLGSLPGGAGARSITVGPGTPLADRYEQSAGRLLLDLGRLPLAAGETRRVEARVGAGQLSVIVPPTVTTDVTADVGVGEADLFGRQHNGAGVDASATHPGIEERGRLQLDLDVGVGRINVVLAEEPTFRVVCQVPADALVATGPVTCPHPPQLATTAMTCSVVLSDPDGLAAGQGFCRRLGAKPPPEAGSFASSCMVPSDSDQATCSGLSPSQLDHLQTLNRRQAERGPGADPSTGTAPAAGAGGALTCGPPDAGGVRTCTEAPAPTTTSTPATFRCTEAPGTGQLSCVRA